MRFREEKPSDLARARKAVAKWRAADSEGTPEQMVGAVGPAFPQEWGIVFRGVLAAVDRHQARTVTGVITGPEVTR
jgi:hypothetical protein